jgi:hypothetical protein
MSKRAWRIGEVITRCPGVSTSDILIELGLSYGQFQNVVVYVKKEFVRVRARWYPAALAPDPKVLDAAWRAQHNATYVAPTRLPKTTRKWKKNNVQPPTAD